MAFFPARCRRAGKATNPALVRGTLTFTYSTITYFIVLCISAGNDVQSFTEIAHRSTG